MQHQHQHQLQVHSLCALDALTDKTDSLIRSGQSQPGPKNRAGPEDGQPEPVRSEPIPRIVPAQRHDSQIRSGQSRPGPENRAGPGPGQPDRGRLEPNRSRESYRLPAWTAGSGPVRAGPVPRILPLPRLDSQIPPGWSRLGPKNRTGLVPRTVFRKSSAICDNVSVLGGV